MVDYKKFYLKINQNIVVDHISHAILVPVYHLHLFFFLWNIFYN